MAAPSSSTTILVVDDEDSVRSLVRDVLVMEGFTVLEARHGEEALTVSRHFEGTLPLIVTDVLMPPYMTGFELVQKLRPSRPEMGVLYISAFPADPMVQEAVLDKEGDFLPKPFSPLILTQRVKHLLSRREAGSEAASLPGPAPGSGALLLYIEDAKMREGLREMLRAFEPSPLLAHTPEDALFIGQWHEGEIALLLTDAELHPDNPEEALSHLRHVRPEMAVLRVHRGEGEEAGKRAAADPEASFLRYPVSPIELRQRILSLLSAPDSAR